MLLEKLIGPQLVKKFYGTQRFITAFTRVRLFIQQRNITEEWILLIYSIISTNKTHFNWGSVNIHINMKRARYSKK